ncbi:MAG: nitroreductase family protein [bacterium]|nr:nitroreductase family protein [bacterium]
MNRDLHFIFARRSVRKFQDKAIPEAMIQDILEAAMAAPSAVKKDPWHFIVIRNRENLEAMARILPHGKMLARAAAGLLICGDIEKAHDQLESYMLQDCSAAIENALLAAHALGLGACWLGVHPRKERIDGLRRLFRLPENIVPISGIALGMPGEQPEARTRYDRELVHWENWGSRR